MTRREKKQLAIKFSTKNNGSRRFIAKHGSLILFCIIARDVTYCFVWQITWYDLFSDAPKNVLFGRFIFLFYASLI